VTQLDATAVHAMLVAEQARFAASHPLSRSSYHAGEQHYLYGAPSHWMRRWAGGFPLYVRAASGARFECIDGHQYVDFCLGDTGAMCGHAPAPVTKALAAQLERGATLMLPTEDAEWVGTELARRFGMPLWGFTTSATDANRAAIRIARLITGRERVLVFNGCYHGSVEEAHVALQEGRVVLRNGIHPNAVDHARVSAVVEFNDVPALEQALSKNDVACVLTEPFITNYGMIAPQPGFLPALRDLTRRTGTLLVIDETHTLSSGPSGYAATQRLAPDVLVLGKSVGGGIPVGLYGMSHDVAEAVWAAVPKVNPALVRQSAHLGFGGTLAGSALQVAAVRAVLAHVLTPSAFEQMTALARRLYGRLRDISTANGLGWFIACLGARVEIMYSPEEPRNATDVARGRDPSLEALLHVYLMNRGVLITPFHSMLLTCPATTEQDIAECEAAIEKFCQELPRISVNEAPR
jgi:glutamate-1-semialdehyde 2,1-aminomutase